MVRILSVWRLGAALLAAQENPADALTVLQQVAEKRSAEWDTLARGLEAKIARLLPCDPRVRSTIEELSRSSDARAAALRQYMEALVAKSREDADALQRVSVNQSRLAKEMSTERAEAEEVRN